MKLFINISSLVTIEQEGKLCKTKEQMQDIGLIKNASLLVSDKIEAYGSNQEIDKYISDNQITLSETIDATGKTIMPGFVDAHTHLVFAGNRSEEFARRLRGVSYQQIAEEGGGIQTTVGATSKASVQELTDNGRKHAHSMLRYGTTSIEAKSGYSLTVDGELNQLRAINALNKELPLDIIPTFLGAHDFPKELKNNHQKYIDQIINEMLPVVKDENLAVYGDAFIDKGYYTIAEGRQVLEACLNAGLKLRVHCDELADVSAAKLAAELGAKTADHLLFVSDESIAALKESNTVAGLLPGTAYFIRMPYAPARKLIDNGNIVSIATDLNPGSCFTENMQTILSLSVINMGMTAEEALVSATLNPAYSLEISDQVGSIEKGKRANIIVLDTPNYTDLFYHFGINHVEQTWIDGKQVFDRRKSWEINY
jgi:imidazolonepropionase